MKLKKEVILENIARACCHKKDGQFRRYHEDSKKHYCNFFTDVDPHTELLCTRMTGQAISDYFGREGTMRVYCQRFICRDRKPVLSFLEEKVYINPNVKN